jgi:hypothetical protein
VAWASAAYWTSLTLIDPLVAALLFLRPRWGVPVTVLLISTNVLHNLWIISRDASAGEFLARVVSSPFVVLQIGFMALVIATARPALRGAEVTERSAKSG